MRTLTDYRKLNKTPMLTYRYLLLDWLFGDSVNCASSAGKTSFSDTLGDHICRRSTSEFTLHTYKRKLMKTIHKTE